MIAIANTYKLNPYACTYMAGVICLIAMHACVRC